MNEEALAGYLLEELLASLIQSAGYRLLTDCSQDPHELCRARNGDLLVRGRGGNHQADVLGEFMLVPTFSQPVRLFVEAKARRSTTGVPTIRNAVGTIVDVNEAWMHNYSRNRTRYHYRYALFSISGFTAPAQSYALAHQISLVDLSGPEWADLVEIATTGASELLARIQPARGPFSIRRLRELLRNRLGTSPVVAPGVFAAAAEALDALQTDVDEFVERFYSHVRGALLVSPASGQVQLARPDNLEAFIARVNIEPEHQVTLLPVGQQAHTQAQTWVIRPLVNRDLNYIIRLTLPSAVERAALAEGNRLSQVFRVKNELGGRLDVLWIPEAEKRDCFPDRGYSGYCSQASMPVEVNPRAGRSRTSRPTVIINDIRTMQAASDCERTHLSQTERTLLPQVACGER
jgi:hypothetical protein